ncbi:hypothetical protein NC651_033998 [Populus alba x Populus x berolinensis]|nr:hypothetical protein NC651_033998 [Populus alba x Populus x berolinensis]
MGGILSTRTRSRYPSSSHSWSHNSYPQSPYAQPSQEHTAYQHHAPPPQSYGDRAPTSRRLERKYSRIDDNYNSLEQVTDALARAGLESSNLIVGIDFTKSNEWTGARSFNRRSLHHIGNEQNPYEQAISIIGKTLSSFDEDNLIPCFGFGDASTHDQEVFSFFPDERFCNGFAEVLTRYRELAPQLRLAGPTSFAPIIEMAITIVEQSGGQYHVLLIIADGQVTRSVDTERGQLSPQEKGTVEAIVKASASRGKGIDRVPLPPPQYGAGADSFRKGIDRVPLPPSWYGAGADSFRNPEPARSSSTHPSAPSSDRHDGTAFPGSSASDNHHCNSMLCYVYGLVLGVDVHNRSDGRLFTRSLALLRHEGWFDEEAEEERALRRVRNFPRLKKFTITKRLKLRVPGLRRFLRKRARLFSRVKVSWLKAWKRLKNGQAHINDLFGGNFLVMQVNRAPFKCGERRFVADGLHGLPPRYPLGKIA